MITLLLVMLLAAWLAATRGADPSLAELVRLLDQVIKSVPAAMAKADVMAVEMRQLNETLDWLALILTAVLIALAVIAVALVKQQQKQKGGTQP